MPAEIRGSEPSPASSSIPFRIFLASPGDVARERQAVRDVVELLRGDRYLGSRVRFELVAWDQPGQGVAMQASITPQQAIVQGLPMPAECDLVLVVLWSRIGTPLPAGFETKPDGTPYLSGTEWEYLNALEGYRERGKPLVWIYHRREEPVFRARDPARKDREDQWTKVETFFAGFTNPDGSLSGGINGYEAPHQFERDLEQHLRNHLARLIEDAGLADRPERETEPPIPPRWVDAPPYPGLEAFTPEQAPIFFGRGPEIDQLIQSLSDPTVRFLAVVGVSGSGKSSLVNAGLIPRLRNGLVAGVPWRDLIFKPGERGERDGGPFLALAYALKGALGSVGRPERELAAELKAEPSLLADYAARLLDGVAPAAELVLVVDQFEELFTQIRTEDLGPFLRLLEAAAAIPRVRVLATLRADFYARAVEEPVLASLLRRDRGTFPLDPPSSAALLEMIQGPARAAGLELEEGLARRVLDDAGNDSGALALTAFALQELYQEAKGTQQLTLDQYESIGGVSGAVHRRADVVLGRLDGDQERALDTLFAHLVEVNEQEVATRRRASKAAAVKDAGALVDRLAEARLLVGGKGADDEPTVEVAHESVLGAWPRLAAWIERNAESVRARRDLERAAKEWDKAGRPGSALRTGAVLKRYRTAAAPRTDIADEYIGVCGRRGWIKRIGFAAAVTLSAVALGVLQEINQSGHPQHMASKGLAARFGLWPVREPEMELIPAGNFEMGDHHNVQEAAAPVHQVQVASFWIGVREVTFDEYDLFAASTNRGRPGDEGWGREDRPVINVTWEDAVAYADWLSEQTGRPYRLPTEVEWEYAARGGKDGEPFFWGGDASEVCKYGNVQDETFDAADTVLERNLKDLNSWRPALCADGFGQKTAPVGTFESNAYGLHDTAGNVWEWVQDCYQESYQGASTDGSTRQPEDPAECGARVVRGGSWNDGPFYARSAVRLRSPADFSNNYLGFRLARSF